MRWHKAELRAIHAMLADAEDRVRLRGREIDHASRYAHMLGQMFFVSSEAATRLCAVLREIEHESADEARAREASVEWSDRLDVAWAVVAVLSVIGAAGWCWRALAEMG